MTTLVGLLMERCSIHQFNEAPATFPLNRVVKGWTEGVQLMVVGEILRFWIPENLAYQDVQVHLRACWYSMLS